MPHVAMALALTSLSLFAESAFAMGPKPPETSDPVTPPTCSVPSGPANPVRKVVVRPVGTKLFPLPNGSQVDMSAELDTLLNTAVTATGTFTPTDPSSSTEPAPCENTLEIRAALTTIELNALQVGISFGYSPSGPTTVPITNLTGQTDIRVGTIAMDFSAWNCSGSGATRSCTSVVASTANQASPGVGLSMTIDFGQVKTGPDLIYNSPLGDAIRAVMNEGLRRMSSSPKIVDLDWNATVREVAADGSTLIFDAGAASNLDVGQTFEIYAASTTPSACNVYKVVAYARTTRVDRSSSVAVIELLDPRGVKDGDVVRVRMK